MVPIPCLPTEAVPPPSYQRALAKQPTALHVTALAMVTTLHLLDLCRLAVQLAHRRCPPPLPKGPGGKPRVYREESLLLIALLRTLWRLSYQDMHDWLRAWPELARACGLPPGADGQPAGHFLYCASSGLTWRTISAQASLAGFSPAQTGLSSSPMILRISVHTGVMGSGRE